MKNIFVVFIAIFIIKTSFGSTEFSGGVFSDQIWTKANSPYIINGDVTLFPNVTLTIESGVEIKFLNNIAFQIRGNIIFNGKFNDSIFLSAQNIIQSQENMSWVGFRIDCAQGGKVFGKYVKAENANLLFNIFSDRDVLGIEFKNSLFKGNNCVIQGIASTGNNRVEITDCIFENNNLGIGETDKLKVSNSIFFNGIQAIRTHERPENTLIKKCEFFKLQIAISTWGTVDSCYIHDNIEGIQIFDLVTIVDSRIEYNIVGLKIVSNPYQIINGNIYDNIICGNGYGIKSENQYAFQLGPNCWCVEDSELYKYIYDAYDDVNLGIVTVTPTQSGCTITPRPPVVTPIDPTTPTDPVTGIKTQSNSEMNNLIIYPNPVIDNKINLTSDVTNGLFYEVYDQVNKLVSYGYIFNQKIQFQENLNTGIYILVIKENNNIVYKNKFIHL